MVSYFRRLYPPRADDPFTHLTTAHATKAPTVQERHIEQSYYQSHYDTIRTVLEGNGNRRTTSRLRTWARDRRVRPSKRVLHEEAVAADPCTQSASQR